MGSVALVIVVLIALTLLTGVAHPQVSAFSGEHGSSAGGAMHMSMQMTFTVRFSALHQPLSQKHSTEQHSGDYPRCASSHRHNVHGVCAKTFRPLNLECRHVSISTAEHVDHLLSSHLSSNLTGLVLFLRVLLPTSGHMVHPPCRRHGM